MLYKICRTCIRTANILTRPQGGWHSLVSIIAARKSSQKKCLQRRVYFLFKQVCGVWRLFCHYLFPISPSFGAPGELCLVIVSFPGYIQVHSYVVIIHVQHRPMKMELLFVCVEVLRPSQPNGVMSSAVSLPNHTFTGQT